MCLVFSRRQPRYRCICESGWEAPPGNAACVADVNECELPNKPCSTNPAVSCYNTQGSFSCGSCPAGELLARRGFKQRTWSLHFYSINPVFSVTHLQVTKVIHVQKSICVFILTVAVIAHRKCNNSYSESFLKSVTDM